VEPGKHLSGVWSIAGIGANSYDLSVHGSNGFFRAFKGGILPGSTRLEVRTSYDKDEITLKITNRGSHDVTVDILDKYTGKIRSRKIESGESESLEWELERFGGWYDFVITAEHDAAYETQVAGHLETGEDSISDPAMGGLV
jgi:phospholipase C